MKYRLIGVLLIVLVLSYGILLQRKQSYSSSLPLVAIANYGQHASLQAAISGMKTELIRQGYIENKTIQYDLQDVNFDLALIPHMITHLQNEKPRVMVVMTTPIAQFAKHKVHDIPLVYGAITDPVDAGLIDKSNHASNNMTGSSDQQNLPAFLDFVKQLLPQANRIGLLYATSEANDLALLKNMRLAAHNKNMTLIALPVDEPRDIPLRMQAFKNKVDFIYVGVSGTIQPTLPVIAIEATKMNIPVFNADDSAVREGIVLGSYGVNYQKVGESIGKLVAKILDGKNPLELAPAYPGAQDSHAVINIKQAHKFGISVSDVKNIVVQEVK